MSPVGRNDCSAQAGFTLVEVVCIMAVMSLLAAIVWPWRSSATSRPYLESIAIDVAALLKADRVAALRSQSPVSTSVGERALVSRTLGRSVTFPADVTATFVSGAGCGGPGAIIFSASGLSCGGSLRLAAPGASLEILINGATGGVEIMHSR